MHMCSTALGGTQAFCTGGTDSTCMILVRKQRAAWCVAARLQVVFVAWLQCADSSTNATCRMLAHGGCWQCRVPSCQVLVMLVGVNTAVIKHTGCQVPGCINSCPVSYCPLWRRCDGCTYAFPPCCHPRQMASGLLGRWGRLTSTHCWMVSGVGVWGMLCCAVPGCALLCCAGREVVSPPVFVGKQIGSGITVRYCMEEPPVSQLRCAQD